MQKYFHKIKIDEKICPLAKQDNINYLLSNKFLANWLGDKALVKYYPKILVYCMEGV